MKKRILELALFVGLGISSQFAAEVVNWKNDPNENNYYGGGGVGLPVQERVKSFDAAEDQANFTYLDDCKNVETHNGKLTFTLKGDQATLGWGNYMGRQPLDKIKSLWDFSNTIVIRMRQSCEKSVWNAAFWADGMKIKARRGRVYKGLQDKDIKGTDWQEVEFSASFVYPIPDGLELNIKAEAGSTFEIDWIKFKQRCSEGFARLEFNIPKGKIWRAVAIAGSGNERHWGGKCRIDSVLYLNGQRVERQMAEGLYGTRPVNILPYLRTGANCVGFYGFRQGSSPFLFFQTSIIMESGEIIKVTTRDKWKVSVDKAAAEWNETGFDDALWNKAKSFQSVVHQKMPPPHEGYLQIKNPEHRFLTYTDQNPMHLVVEIPEGLADLNPRVEYLLCGVKADGSDDNTISEGTISTFSQNNGSLVYQLNLGKQKGALYTVRLQLVSKSGKVLDERPREALLVTRKLNLKKIKGTSYTQGLDLELEDEIDFTNPDDDHPWIEAEVTSKSAPKRILKAKIVEKDGMVYRELSDKMGAGWLGSYVSYRLGEFKHPGDFYLFELQYPDNGDRGMEVSVTKIGKTGLKKPNHVRIGSGSQAGVGAEVGGKFFNSGKMKTLSWLFVADSGVHTLDIKTMHEGWPAAVKSVKIYHVKGDLPAIDVGSSRHYGIHTERHFYANGYCRVFGKDMPWGCKTRAERKEFWKKQSFLQRYLQTLNWLLKASENYTQYLKFSGQNINIMGCYQYRDCNTPYVPADSTSRVPPCPRSVLANVLDANGIDFIAGIEYSNTDNLRTWANNAQVAAGADSVWMIDREGKQLYGKIGTIVPNWLHPRFKKRYLELIKDLATTFSDFKHFKGVSNFTSTTQRTNYYFPAFALADDSPLHFSYDDFTFAMFAKDTGNKFPIDPKDPSRFEKRASLLNNPELRAKFLAWRCRRLEMFLADALKCLRGKRTDLRFLDILSIETSSLFKDLYEKKSKFSEYLKDYGIDLQGLGKIEGLVPVRWTISWRARGLAPSTAQDPFSWIARENDLVIDAFRGLPEQGVLCRTSWRESGMNAPKGLTDAEIKKSDWLQKHTVHRIHPQPGGAHARETIIQAIITTSPQWLFSGFTDVMLNIGHEQPIREIASIYTQLPVKTFERVLNTGLTSMFAIRKVADGEQSWFYIANPAFWPVKGTIDIVTGGPVIMVGNEKQVSSGGVATLSISLPPYGLVAYKVDSKNLAIKGYKTDKIPEAELSHLTGILDRVENLVNNKMIKLALGDDDRQFMLGTVKRARTVIAEGEYAMAWSMIKEPRFWYLWKTYLEKAVNSLALLPRDLNVAAREDGKSSNSINYQVPTINAFRTKDPIEVDGKLSEAVWEKVPFTSGFCTRREGFPAMNETGVKVLFDDKAIYFGFICADKNAKKLKGNKIENEKSFWQARDDALDVFIQPDENQPLHYQFAFNPIGMKFDQEMKGGDPNYAYDPDWKSVATVQNDQYWTAEMKLPFKALGLDGPGKTNWRVNFFRIMRDKLLPHAEWSECKNWHDETRFGKLVFKEGKNK